MLNYKTVGDFLSNLKEEFGREDEEVNKVVELRNLEQKGKTIEEFVQEFRKVTRGSRYKGRPLIEEFKCSINKTIQQRLMKSEYQLDTIKQWYE